MAKNVLEEYIEHRITIKVERCLLTLHSDYNNYTCRFLYNKKNILKYVRGIIDIFSVYKCKIISSIANGELLSIEANSNLLLCDGKKAVAEYSGNYLAIRTIPFILYKLLLCGEIDKKTIIDFAKSNKDYYNVVPYFEIFYVISIVGEKRVSDKRKGKEK